MGAISFICQHAGSILVKGGWLMFEHGWQQASPTTAVMKDAGFVEVETFRDLQGHERVTLGRTP